MEENQKMTDEWEEKKGDSNFWNPIKEGDTIEGVIVSQINERFGLKTTIEVTLNDEHKQIVLPSHKVLQNRIADCKIGDIIRVIFEKEELPKVRGQNPTKIYKVFVKKQESKK